MRTDRLLRLADHLEQVVALKPPELFDMSYWGMADPNCGTVCCAVGHACDVPEFRDAGLVLVWPEPGAGARRRKALPAFAGLEGMWAVRAFFDIDEDGLDLLFTPEGYHESEQWSDRIESEGGTITPRIVADRIRAYVAAAR